MLTAAVLVAVSAPNHSRAAFAASDRVAFFPGTESKKTASAALVVDAPTEVPSQSRRTLVAGDPHWYLFQGAAL